jgi:Holliday junction resolvasome RuvABC endonuclease subunit
VNVLGLDLSLTAPGFAFSDRASGMISRNYTHEKIAGDLRLNATRDVVRHIVKHTPIALAVIEAPAYAANGMFQMGLVHSAARVVLNDYQVPYATVSPGTLKQFATGWGNADKEQMIAAVTAVTGVVPGDDNQADAWWLRAMGLAALGHPNIEMNDARRQRIASCEWPAPVNGWGAYGVESKRPPAKCGHDVYALANAGRLIHAFSLTVCDKPTKTRRKKTTT